MPLSPDLFDRVVATRRALYEGAGEGELREREGLVDAQTLVKLLTRPARTRPDTLTAPKANLRRVLGARRVLVLLVDFSDEPATQSPEHFADLLFSQGTRQGGSMRDYFAEASYGQLDVRGAVHGSGGPVQGWFRAPQPKAHYTNGDFGFAAYPRNAQRLVEDVLALADGTVDFSVHDQDGDGLVEALVLVCAGRGAEETGDTGDLWSHKWGVEPQQRDGVTLSPYFMAPENGKVGVMAHELGHLLLGWPDLYDTDYSSSGTGSWDLMAGGSWNGGGDRPAHPSAWCKVQAGWVAPTTITGAAQDVALAPYHAAPEVVQLPVGAAGTSEYFLLSNRQQQGYDDQLPASGLLIEHCDDAVANNTDEDHYLVDVEQCDGRRDLNLGANRGDASDVWPASGATAFDQGSTPSSDGYDGAASGIAVTGIARDGERITARVAVAAAAGGAAGPQWLYGRAVTATYVHHSEQAAWAHVDGLGWRRVKEGAGDGVGSLAGLCAQAVADGRTVHVNVDGEHLYAAYLL